VLKLNVLALNAILGGMYADNRGLTLFQGACLCLRFDLSEKGK
jgi:hypothetical protein